MFEELFTSMKIGKLEIPNRFVMPAMDSHLTDGRHHFTRQAADYYAERAKGGYGLQITEFLAVSRDGIANEDQAGIYDDECIPSLKMVADAVHENGGIIFAQLQHSGRVAALEDDGLELIGPSPIPYLSDGRRIREILTDEIPEIEERFVAAALRARKAGFDGVELHGAHGYLFDQFLSKRSNNRADLYGGNAANRARIVCEAVRKVKDACGQDFPVSVRINGRDPLDYGNTIEDATVQALAIEAAGADVLNVSYGVPIETYYKDAGFNLDNVKKIRDVLSIPVIGVGRINEPLLALLAIKGGYMDLVATGRQSIADPHFPEKIRENRMDEIISCTGCLQRCLHKKFFEEGFGISCMNNPFSGKEGNWKIEETAEPKKIAVIGAGPAGTQCAWILAKKGHDVDVYEREEMPGGQFRLASVPPMKSALAKTIATYVFLGKKYGARYHYGTEADAEMLSDRYDIVIDATGSVPVIPRIEGIHNENVFTAQEVLRFEKQFMNKKLLVLGAGLVGAETAEVLANSGNKVCLVDMLSSVAPLAPGAIRRTLIRHLEEKGVEFVLNSKVMKINEDGINYQCEEEERSLSGYDAIILAFGSRSNTRLRESLEGSGVVYYAIGDSLKAGDAKKAIFEATRLALDL